VARRGPGPFGTRRRPAVELLWLTAARTDEALGANRGEFDLDRAVWSIPGERMKAGEDHAVFLVPRAVEIVREQLALMPDAPVLFPSPMDTEKPLSNMALLAVLDRMGMRQATTVHGLRSTFSTWANETQAARPDVIEACLAHQETDRVRAAYAVRRGTADAAPGMGRLPRHSGGEGGFAARRVVFAAD
jgi:integrase